jgi:hypothetical protein
MHKHCNEANNRIKHGSFMDVMLLLSVIQKMQVIRSTDQFKLKAA